MRIIHYDRPCGLMVQDIAVEAVSLGLILGSIRSGAMSLTARHRDVSSELCCPGFKLRRWVTPLVTSFGVIPRVITGIRTRQDKVFDEVMFFFLNEIL